MVQYNIDRTLTGRIYLTLFNTHIDLLTLLETTLVCSFHFKSSLMMTPKHLVSTLLYPLCGVHSVISTLIITLSSIVRTVFAILFSSAKNNISCFFKFNDSLLALNHSEGFIYSLLNISKQWSMLLSEKKIFVSSAIRMNFKNLNIGKSLT